MAKEQEEVTKKIEAAEDKVVDMAWYRMWVTNRDVDLFFLPGKLDQTLEFGRIILKKKMN